MSFQINMPYIGGILSKNASRWHKTRGMKFPVRMWMKELTKKAMDLNISNAPFYIIEVKGLFEDNRSPDVHNFFEVIADALKKKRGSGGLGVDDKFFKMVDRGFKTGYFDQELIVTIIPQEEG